MRRATRIALLPAVLTAALLLAACGDSKDESSSTTTAPAASGKVETPTATAKAKAKAEGGEGRTAQDRPGQSRQGGKMGSEEKPRNDSRSGAKPKAGAKGTGTTTAPAANDGPAPDRPKQVHIKGCPTGMTKSQCEQVGIAYEQQQGSSTEVKTNECPAAMTSEQCDAAGKAYEESKAGSKVVPADQCPAAMTEEQCIAAGQAYQEATK